MNRLDLVKQYKEFCQLRGQRVVQTPSGLWVEVRPFIFQSSPPFNLSPRLSEEAPLVFKQASAIVCRYFSVNSSSKTTIGPFLYCLHPPYDLSSLQQKARNQTRRGLERVIVRREFFDEQVECLAYDVYRDNILRLGLMKTEEQIRSKWASWTRVLKSASCVEFWCAWRDDRLLAFSVIAWTPWGAEILLQRSASSALRFYPNNALVYTIAQDIFNRGASLLSFGLSSFIGTTNGLHHFKVNMGFEAIPLVEHFCWHPIVRPLISRISPEFMRRGIFKTIARKVY